MADTGARAIEKIKGGPVLGVDRWGTFDLMQGIVIGSRKRLLAKPKVLIDLLALKLRTPFRIQYSS